MYRQSVVVLGASSDIGRVLVKRALAESGATVLAVSRRVVSDADRIEIAAEAAKETTVRWLDGIDLAESSSLQKLEAVVSETFDGPFAVIHSVGDFWVHRPLIDTPFAETVRMVTSQVLTLFGMATYLTPLMIRNGGGRVVAFSCNSVSYSYPDMSPFTASKAAVESFVKCYANENSEFGISACALALPTIRTPTVVREKPAGDHVNYITPEQLADHIFGHVLAESAQVNGNVVKLFKHSPTFYHSSYYDRNPRKLKGS